MTSINGADIFTREKLDAIFPADRADTFFDALYGDASEGAYDISLEYKGIKEDQLLFEFHLKQRPGKCLVCNLTYGLPTVFERHPVINLDGVAHEIMNALAGAYQCDAWKVGRTKEVNRKLHILPISFFLSPKTVTA